MVRPRGVEEEEVVAVEMKAVVEAEAEVRSEVPSL